MPACFGAGLWNGAFQRDPRPVFFAIMYGVRASVPARPLAMKALGMWDWEVRPTAQPGPVTLVAR